MKKILSLLRNIGAILCAIILVAVLGVFASGTLTPEKAGYIFDVLQGTLFPPEEKQEPLSFEETQAEAEKILAANLELRKEWKKKLEEKPMEISRLTSYLETLRLSLGQIMDDIKDRRIQLNADIQAFREERNKFEQAIKDEGFAKKLEVISKLEAEQAAATIREWDDEEILPLFRRLKSSKLGEIIIELNRFPARKGKGTRGAELLKKLDEFTMASTAEASVRDGQARQKTP